MTGFETDRRGFLMAAGLALAGSALRPRNAHAEPAPLCAQKTQHPAAVALQLRRADAFDLAQFVETGGTGGGDFTERGIVEAPFERHLAALFSMEGDAA